MTDVSTQDVLAVEPAPTGPRKFEGRSPGQLAWIRLRRDRSAMTSGVILLIFILVAILAPVIEKLYGISQNTTFTAQLSGDAIPLGYLGGITGEHWLGLEPGVGRDLFIQIVFGIRTSLMVAFLAAVLSTALGVVLGVVAGYLGGWVDNVIGWVVDFVLALPTLILFLAVMPAVQAAFFSQREAPSTTFKVFVLVTVFTIFGWVGTARLVRGQVLSMREREYVEAARAAGAGTWHILFKQLLPNLWAPILVTFSLSVPGYVTSEGALSFLGVGVTEPTPDMGRLIFDSTDYLQTDAAYFLFPAATLFLIVFTFNLFGDSMRDALDPKSSR